MRLRSRPARVVSSTRYAIFGAYFVKYFAGRPRPAFPGVFKALPDAFFGAGFRQQIQELLVSSGVLDDRFGFPVDSEDYRPPGFFKALHELSRITPESRHGLDVFGNVEHSLLPL